MVAPRFLPVSFSLLASGLVAVFAGTAHAGQSCAQDTDCGHGFACKVVSASGCAGVACPEGAPCPAPPPCMVTEIKECMPAPCIAHSDCADGMVCYGSAAITTCPTAPAGAPACPPNADCFVPPLPPSDCTTVTVTMCTPRYELPCANEASCGAGFNCVPDPEACSCSGSGSAPANGTSTPSSGPSSGVGGTSGGGAPLPPGTATPPPADPAEPPPGGFAPPSPVPVPPPDCTCTPSTTKHCEPKVVSCSLDSDCPATWTCVTSRGTSGGCASGARILPDGGIEEIPPVCDPAPPTTTTRQCVPPYYGGGSHGGGTAGAVDLPATGGGTTGSQQPPPVGSPKGDPRVPAPIPVPNPGGEVGNNADPSSDSTQGASHDDGSCQMSAGHASTTGASLLALLGVAGMARRRRTRWG